MINKDQRSVFGRWLRGRTGNVLYGIFSALVIFILFFQISKRTDFFTATERVVNDSLFRLREPGMEKPNRYVSDRACLLAFTEDSQAVIGRWPWKRYVHADVLGKIQQFSPKRIMIDLLFINPEQPPEYLLNFLDVEEQTKKKITSLFSDMDSAMAQALALRANVYLDFQLIDRPRQDLPPEYIERITLNEKQVLKYAVPAGSNDNALVFASLEPVLTEYMLNSKPALINVPQDIDGKIRRWPLYYVYEKEDGTRWRLPSAVLQLIKDYYYVNDSSVHYLDDKVVLRNAKVPGLDQNTSRTQVSVCNFKSLLNQVTNKAPPADYAYNANLYRLLASPGGAALFTNGALPFALHLVHTGDGRAEILDGWEILGAASSVGAEKVNVVWYKQSDVEIPFVTGAAFYINYCGTEGNYYIDKKTGEQKMFSRVPVESYSRIYSDQKIPDLPDLDQHGRIDTNSYDLATLEAWFLGYCQVKSDDIRRKAWLHLEKKAEDPEALLGFLNEHPEEGRFFLYNEFFARNEPKPGMLRSLYEKYHDFATQMKQDPKHYLAEDKIVYALRDSYREHFEKYLGKYVFAGGTSLGIGDVLQTPYQAMFGIQVIVNAFNTLATGNILMKSGDIPYFDAIMLFVVCLAGGITYSMMNVRVSWIIFVLSFAGIFVFTRFFFENRNFIPASSLILSGNLFTFVSSLIFKLLTEERDRRFLHKTFNAYLAPEIIKDMFKKRTMPALGGENKHATAYFTDIVGFSTFSEKLSPRHLLELLNEYLSVMTGILTGENGTLDKYIGDAIVAFFGAPTPVPDHSLRACRVAIKMQKGLAALREKWASAMVAEGDPARNLKNVPPEIWAPGHKWPIIVHGMKMRIGINTGDLIVGNMGSDLRMNYTMMGDAVNLAARLEAAAKQYGVFILASEATMKDEVQGENGNLMKVEDFVAARLIDRVVVVGRSTPVNIYELIDMKESLTDHDRALVEAYSEGMRNYFAMNWDQAILYFRQAEMLERFPGEKITPSKLLISRCLEYREKPPVSQGQEWDGVYTLTKK